MIVRLLIVFFAVSVLCQFVSSTEEWEDGLRVFVDEDETLYRKKANTKKPIFANFKKKKDPFNYKYNKDPSTIKKSEEWAKNDDDEEASNPTLSMEGELGKLCLAFHQERTPSFFKKFGVVTGLIEDIEQYKMNMKMAKDGLKRSPGVGIVGDIDLRTSEVKEDYIPKKTKPMKPGDKLALKKYRYYQKLNAKLQNDDEDIDYSDVHKFSKRSAAPPEDYEHLVRSKYLLAKHSKKYAKEKQKRYRMQKMKGMEDPLYKKGLKSRVRPIKSNALKEKKRRRKNTNEAKNQKTCFGYRFLKSVDALNEETNNPDLMILQESIEDLDDMILSEKLSNFYDSCYNESITFYEEPKASKSTSISMTCPKMVHDGDLSQCKEYCLNDDSCMEGQKCCRISTCRSECVKMKGENEQSEQDSMMADVQISKKEHKKRTCGKADRFIQCLYESVKENLCADFDN